MMGFEHYKKQSLWSESELKSLCCGLAGQVDLEPHLEEINTAAEMIRRACLAGDLEYKSPIDASQGDKLYGHARFFRPVDAVNWALPLFPKFPEELKQLANDNLPTVSNKVASKGLPETERKTLLRLVLGMAIDAYGYDVDSKKNTATGDKNGISAKLLLRGIEVDADTVRKYLNEAKDNL